MNQGEKRTRPRFLEQKQCIENSSLSLYDEVFDQFSQYCPPHEWNFAEVVFRSKLFRPSQFFLLIRNVVLIPVVIRIPIEKIISSGTKTGILAISDPLPGKPERWGGKTNGSFPLDRRASSFWCIHRVGLSRFSDRLFRTPRLSLIDSMPENFLTQNWRKSTVST